MARAPKSAAASAPSKAAVAAKPASTAKAPRSIASTQSLSAFVKGICDIMRRSNCASALQ